MSNSCKSNGQIISVVIDYICCDHASLFFFNNIINWVRELANTSIMLDNNNSHHLVLFLLLLRGLCVSTLIMITDFSLSHLYYFSFDAWIYRWNREYSIYKYMVHIYVYMYCIYVHMYVCTVYICIYVYMYISILHFICIFMHQKRNNIYVCVSIYIYIHIHTVTEKLY